VHAAGAAQREFVFAKSARDQCPVSEKLLKLDRSVADRFYALSREQFNPNLTVPDASSMNEFPWEPLEQKKIHRQPEQVVIGRLPKEPDADHQE
jgi:hypothetical protein